MKRNLFQRLSACCVRRAALSALLAGGLLAACSDDPADGGQGRPFAAGEHPVVLTGAVETATRTTADDTWSGGEQVAVEAAPNTAGAQPEVKTYTADGDGRLTSDAPFWWTNSAEKKTLRAWYCGDGSTAAGGLYASAAPTAWSVKADQSGEGYGQSDLLFAPATEAAFAGDAAVPLRFYHQTAKVVVNIREAETVTDDAQIKAVRIGDGNLVLATDFIAPADGATAGTWATDGAAAEDTVTPRKLAAPSDADKYVATYEALVIPQPTAKKRMVAIETDFGTMYYTAPDDAEQLEAGKVRTYNITVKETELNVTVEESAGWTEDDQTGSGIEATYRIRVPQGVTVEGFDGSSATEATGYYELSGGNMFKVSIPGQSDKFFEDAELTGNFEAAGKYWSYADGEYSRIFKTKSDIVVGNPIFGNLESEVKIGDIYYCDGTWSSTLRGKKEPLGIVFHAGKHEKDSQNYNGKPGSVKGYVVALNDADASSERAAFGSGADISGFDTDTEKFTGYERTQTMKGATGFSSETHRAVWQAVNHTPAAPEGSSGWYLPSLGEWNVLWQNYGTVQSQLTAVGGSDMKKNWGFYWAMSKKENGDTQPAFVDFGAWNASASFANNIRNNDPNAYSRPIFTF